MIAIVPFSTLYRSIGGRLCSTAKPSALVIEVITHNIKQTDSTAVQKFVDTAWYTELSELTQKRKRMKMKQRL